MHILRHKLINARRIAYEFVLFPQKQEQQQTNDLMSNKGGPYSA